MAADPDCLFCKLAAGTIPVARIYEDDLSLAFLDIGPINPGHLLLIPKGHHATLADVPDDLAAALGALLPRLCRAVQSATGAEGLNVIANLGAVAGQSVPHCHWHVIPRHADDAFRWPWPAGKYDGEALERTRAGIASALAAE